MMLLNLIFGFLIVINVTSSTLNSDGFKCGQKQCSSIEYCSAFDSLCKPCLTICDERNHNHDISLCVKDCQEYLHDQKYVLRAEPGGDGNLQEEVERLSTLVKVSFALKILLTLSTKKITDKVHNDVEICGGGVKSQQQNNARLIMPTISEDVAPSSQYSNECSKKNTPNNALPQDKIIEENSLNFSYDNPAMTPNSNTAAQPKSKYEKQFLK